MFLMEKYKTRMTDVKMGNFCPEFDDALLDTPQAKLGKPLLIESERLGGETIYLVANEAQAQRIGQAESVCYLPGEIRTLLSLASGTDQEGWTATLRQIHEVKKTFRGSRIDAGLG